MADGKCNGVCLCCGAQASLFKNGVCWRCGSEERLFRSSARYYHKNNAFFLQSPKSRTVLARIHSDVVCYGCQKVFSGIANGRRKFCSSECRRFHTNKNARDKLAAKRVPSGKCVKCGKATRGFSTGWAAKYCSRKCWPRKNRKRGPFVCRGCGISYFAKCCGDGEKYCSRKCYFSARKTDRVGPHYGERSLTRQRANLLAKQQDAVGVAQRKAERYARRLARSLVVRLRNCRLCGKAHVWQKHYYYCSDICGKRAKELGKERWKASVAFKRSKRIHKAKRRAVERGVQSARVDPIDVFIRDRWRCTLCGTSTPRSLRGSYDDRAPELDHVIPLALGGAHAWHNLQCTCRRCNGLKGAKALGQLGLNLGVAAGDPEGARVAS